MTAKPTSYESMSKELEEIIVSLQSSDVNLEGAMKKYERGMELVNNLENYLKEAQNKIKKVKSVNSKKSI